MKDFIREKVIVSKGRSTIISVRNLLVASLLIVTFSLNGCTPEKAKALRELAIAFGNQSSLTLDALDKMIRSETEVLLITDEEVSKLFVDTVLDPKLDSEQLKKYLNSDMPLKPFPGNSDNAERDISIFIGKLRYQYGSLVAIYEDVEKAYLTGQDAVKRSKEPLQKLTAQMAYFALCIDASPPRLLTQRASFIADVERLRDDYFAVQDSGEKTKIRYQLIGRLTQLREIKNREKELQRAVIENATKASVLGLELAKKIDEYDQISLEDLSFLIPKALNAASLLTGKDTIQLRQKASEVLIAIQQDEDFRRVANSAIRELQPSYSANSSNPPQSCSPLKQSNSKE